jgi:hypothetical protein
MRVPIGETLRISPIGAADYIRLPACGSLMLASAYQADGADPCIGAGALPLRAAHPPRRWAAELAEITNECYTDG